MHYLQKCLNLYKQNFSSYDWLDKNYNWDDDKQSKSSYIDALKKLSKFPVDAFLLLSKSLLSGEYVVDIDTAKSILQEIVYITLNEYIPNTDELLPDTDELLPDEGFSNRTSILPFVKDFKKELSHKFSVLNRELFNCALEYKQIISVVESQTDRSDHNYIFRSYTSPDQIDKIDKSILSDFVAYVVPLVQKDFLFSYTADSVEQLIRLQNEIESKQGGKPESEIQHIYKVLLEKCKFLLKKILYVSGDSEYLFNFISYSIKYDDISLDLFTEFLDYFSHLHIETDSKYSSLRNDLRKKRITLIQILLFLRYCQKNKNYSVHIDAILDFFEDKYHLSDCSGNFDKYAYCTLKNYLYDSRLSFNTKKPNYKFKDLESDLNEIRNIQKNTGIRNFYPYKKCLMFLRSDIEKSFDAENSFKQKEEIQKKIDIFRNCCEELKKSLVWCKDRNFYPFQLPYKDCIVHYDPLNLDLFIPSTFIRPLKYDILVKELHEFESNMLSFKILLKMQDSKKKTQETSEKIENTQRKNIEIMTVFTAVITFMFGNFEFQSNIRDVDSLFMASATLGLILLLFVSVMFFLTAPAKDNLCKFITQPRSLFFIASTIIYWIIINHIVEVHQVNRLIETFLK